jgi:hypothetical protein
METELKRSGNFSSSSIHMLMSKGAGNWKLENIGKPFSTYVQNKVWENKLGRELNKEQKARSTTWGTFVETIVFANPNYIGMDYELISKDRIVHPTIPQWTGAPDCLTIDKQVVVDIKCPWTLNSYCGLVDAMRGGMESLKKYSPTYYWQLVSSSILTGAPFAELIVYVPSLVDLEEIKKDADGNGDLYFIVFALDEELPYLTAGEYYQNIEKLRFEVPQTDKELLTSRVEMAVKELNKQLNNK